MAEKRDYWCQLSREDSTSHGATLNSPSFADEGELWAWVRENRRAGDDIAAYRRQIKIGANSFVDVPLTTADENDMRADAGRLHELLAGLSETLRLKAAARGMPPPGTRRARSGETARERGVQAHERLMAAGAALMPPEREDEEPF